MLLNCGVEEDSWESLGLQEIKPVHPKGNQSWIFIGRTAAEAETPILWPPDVKSWLIWKGPDAGKDWGQEEKVMTEDEMVGWHHWLNGYEFEQAPAVGDGQGRLARCGSGDCKGVGHDWTAACEASLSITNSQSLIKFMSFESVMPSNNLILCRPFLLLPSVFPMNIHSVLISFRMDGLDLLAVQGTLKVFSSTTVQKHQFFGAQLSLYFNSHIHTWLLVPRSIQKCKLNRQFRKKL